MESTVIKEDDVKAVDPVLTGNNLISSFLLELFYYNTIVPAGMSNFKGQKERGKIKS